MSVNQLLYFGEKRFLGKTYACKISDEELREGSGLAAKDFHFFFRALSFAARYLDLGAVLVVLGLAG